MTEEELIFIHQRKIKGKFDYHRILNGGIDTQKQFLRHLNYRGILWTLMRLGNQNHLTLILKRRRMDHKIYLEIIISKNFKNG